MTKGGEGGDICLTVLSCQTPTPSPRDQGPAVTVNIKLCSLAFNVP